MDAVPLTEFHSRVDRDTFPNGMGEADALLLFTILHCYQIELAGPVIAGNPIPQAGSRLPADTQRCCGEAISELWVGTDTAQANYVYWYHLWQEWGSYSRLDQLTPDERRRMREMIGELEKHRFMIRLVPEDFDPAADPE